MSDNSISFVPKHSTVSDPKSRAKEILNWLVTQDIVKPSLSDCILSTSEHGYAISDGAREISEFPDYLPYELNVNGLEITTDRQIFDTGGNFVDSVVCPNCHSDIAFADWDLEPWSNQESDNLKCPSCQSESEIHNFKFEPEWGFSNLGFTFWNWPNFKETFSHEFKQRLGGEINIVYRHI